jgi:alkanesulfonate monooxygenase SsuD/methylene tetrahydromethanopterin reductase-like flavin-dependent oxidoreductase (luciferase family)
LVTFDGKFHQLERCCINPRPNRSIPIWVGGFSEPAFSRAARLGDGFTFAGDQDDAIAGMVRVRELLAENGRSDADFGFEYTLTRARDVASVLVATERWQEAGGNGVSVLTQKIGFDSVAGHIDYLAEVKQAIDARFGS